MGGAARKFRFYLRDFPNEAYSLSLGFRVRVPTVRIMAFWDLYWGPSMY